jgi:hypothetical protein
MKRIESIGHIDIPAGVLDHRFVLEARANAALLTKHQDDNRQVVGTSNTRLCELYGWAPNVEPHVDNTGIVYLVGLDDLVSHLYAWAGAPSVRTGQVGVRRARGSKLHFARLAAGTVVRLDDFAEHWTEDTGPRVAAFVGSFEKPDDDRAMEILRAGVAALARGDYYGAPRVPQGYRAMLPDECFAANDDWSDCEVMLLDDARAKKRLVQLCGKCDRPAVRMDRYWPNFHDMNRCREHINAKDEA